jgi:hypothetical protein
MDNLIKSLPGVLSAARASPEVSQAAAFAAFTHTAGEGLRSHAVPRQLNDDGTLVIAVSDVLWQKQLKSMLSELIFRTNTLLGSAIVKNIEFQIDPLLVKSKRPTTEAVEEINETDVPLEVWAAANAIHDRELRLKFLRTAVIAIKRQEKK